MRSRGFLQLPYRPCFAANGFSSAGEFTPTLKPLLLVQKTPSPTLTYAARHGVPVNLSKSG